VVELSMVGPRHVRLLEVARQMHVEVLGVGSLPQWANAELLSGVRLISWSQLPAAIEAAARALGPVKERKDAQTPAQAGKLRRPDAETTTERKDAEITEPLEAQGVYESDVAPEPDFDLEGPDLAGTYQQELAPDRGRQPHEQPQDPRPDPQPQPQSNPVAAHPQIPPFEPGSGVLSQVVQSQPPKPLRPQSPGTTEESQLLDTTADGASRVSAEDIGRWISGLDEDHAAPRQPHGDGHSAPRSIDEPQRVPAPKTFKPHELTGLLTPEELDALLGRDK
jgi:hypothetical protein